MSAQTGRKLALVLLLWVAGAMLLSCAKDPVAVDRNRPPQTFLVGAPIDTTAADVGYSYRIHLYWRGEDPDGYVVGFLYSWDDSSIGAFRFTTRTDSIFELAVNDSETIGSGVGNPQTSRYHTFFIRAVDNLGKPDPSLTMFNRRLFNAETEVPRVTFVGDIPNLNDEFPIDTLCDKTPFTVCWTGFDPDGFVTRYRVDAGSYRSPLMTDTCITFNTPGGPTLASGLYTMTVTAVDNANAVGTGSIQFVVNKDPETRFVDDEGGGARIYYIRHFRNGAQVFEPGSIGLGDTTDAARTIPYRSTVWFYWEGEDSHGCEPDSLTGFSLRLDNGTRNGNDPYIIGFLDVLSETPPIRFTSNDPEKLNQAGFSHLILDSLDAGIDIVARVAARDDSQRPDGTPASIRFNCNFPPQLLSVTVDSISVDPDGGGPDTTQAARLIQWQGTDDEDGATKFATIVLDETSIRELSNYEQQLIVLDRTFRALSPSGIEHSVRVRVADRAEFMSPLPDGMKTVLFTIPLLTP
jgi:hypothetical protein